MTFRLRNNVSALRAVNNVYRSNTVMERSFDKIAHGLRVVRARDGVADQALTARLNSLNQSWNSALRNTSKGMSLVQTAESDLGSIGDILIRMRELAVQASNGAYTDATRRQVNAEFVALRSEIQRIASMSQFNGISLLSKSSGVLTLQIGVHSPDSISLRFGGSSSVTTNNTNNGNGNSNGNVTALNNRNKNKNQTLNALVIDLASIGVSLGGLGISLAGVSTYDGAHEALDDIDDALYSVLEKRAILGSTFNQLQHALAESTDHQVNVRASQSQILDLDYAREASMLSRFRIIHQAGVASVGQASRMNRSVLSLLG